MKITLFIFSMEDGTEFQFLTPQEAIDYFTKKGYGMHNWRIQVKFDNYYKSTSDISLLVFNYITDNWV